MKRVRIGIKIVPNRSKPSLANGLVEVKTEKTKRFFSYTAAIKRTRKANPHGHTTGFVAKYKPTGGRGRERGERESRKGKREERSE